MSNDTLISIIELCGNTIANRAKEIAGNVDGMTDLDISITIGIDRLPTITWTKEIAVNHEDCL